MDSEFDIPWVGGQNIMGIGDQNTIGNGVTIPWVEFQFSIYCNNAIQN